MSESYKSLGFELSKSTIRLVASSKANHEITIDDCASKSLESPDKAHVAEKIREIIPESHQSAQRISLSVWDSSLIVRKITMPLMTPKELSGAIRFEAEKHIPFSIDDCVLDHVLIHRNEAAKQMGLVLIACKKSVIDSHLEVFRQAGQGLDIIDIHPFSLYNAFDQWCDYDSKTAALIHLGEAGNFLHVVKEGLPALIRDVGPEVLTDARPGLSDRFVEETIENIKASVMFFENSFDETLDTVHLSGWCQKEQEFIRHIEESLERKVNCWSAHGKMNFVSDDIREAFKAKENEFLIAAGLARR